MSANIEPKSESIYSDNSAKTVWKYYDEESKPIHVSRVIHKHQSKIEIFPFSYSDINGLKSKRINHIELRGWNSIDDIPALLKTGGNVRVTTAPIKFLMSFLYNSIPDFKKLIIVKTGKTRFLDTSITFLFSDFEALVKLVRKEANTYVDRRKTTLANSVSMLTSKIDPVETDLPMGALDHFISLYTGDIRTSNKDIDAVLNILGNTTKHHVSVKEHFIQTKDKMNSVYLEDVISKFEKLIKVTNDNEKDWQRFFEEHGWILSNLFSFPVILHKREAYVGGKTLENTEGRVVDFLYHNGFQDNYALLEIKTHNKKLLNNIPFRQPAAYAAHKDLSESIAQCLDQKSIFIKEFGQKYSIHDPKSLLIIGNKSKLKDEQSASFELTRSNQKNIEIVTFDELLGKIKGLHKILMT